MGRVIHFTDPHAETRTVILSEHRMCESKDESSIRLCARRAVTPPLRLASLAQGKLRAAYRRALSRLENAKRPDPAVRALMQRNLYVDP